MKLLDILTDDQVILPLKNHEKEKIIEEMVDHLYRKKKIKNRAKILKAILDREQVMSTGVGDGVALPHGKAEGVSEMLVVLGIANREVDFHSMDNKPVRFIFMLIGPPDKAGPHLKALGRISELMRQREFRERLMQASTVPEVMQAIQEADDKYHDSD